MLLAALKVINMGATNFYCKHKGSTAAEAFSEAVKEAKWENGHAGYTGTIAEKTRFSMASDKPLSIEDANDLANSLINTKYNDKWGPAGCISLISNSKEETLNTYLFFGWASS